MREEIQKVIDVAGLTPDSVRQLNDLAVDGFARNPSVPNFVARGVFRELSDRWDDGQGIPSGSFDKPNAVLLPRLRIWVQSELSYMDPNEIEKVVRALSDSFSP